MIASQHRLFVLKSNTDIVASTLNYNFSFLYNYLSAIATDRVLISELERSTILAELVASALFAPDSAFLTNLVSELSDNTEFIENTVDALSINPTFISMFLAYASTNYVFLSALAEAIISGTADFPDMVAMKAAQDTRGINTRTDVTGVSSSAGGRINYLGVDSGYTSTKKRDAASVASSSYATSSTYDIDGDYFVIDVDPDGIHFKMYRYDDEATYLAQHTVNKALYLAGPDGIVGGIYTSTQYLKTTTCISESNGLLDKSTGEILAYDDPYNLSNPPVSTTGIIPIQAISVRIVETTPSERFIFKTFNKNVSDNGFIVNVANAMVANETLTYEIGEVISENPVFATRLSQNLQKVHISISTDELGGGTTGSYYDNIMGVYSSGLVLDDNTVRYQLTPRLMNDGSGNLGVVSEPWIIGQIVVTPFLDTSGSNLDISGVGIDPSGGCYLDINGIHGLFVGEAVKTGYQYANSVAYIREINDGGSSATIYLTNNQYTKPIISNWAYLGWSAPPTSADLIKPDTLDIEANYDVSIYPDVDWYVPAYSATANIQQLNDLRSFWYYAGDHGKLYLEIKNNFGALVGNPNKYTVDIYGYRLIDRDIIYTPGNLPHDHVVGEDLTPLVDGVETDFPTAFTFVANSTRIFVNGVAVRRGISGDPTSGDYYEVGTNQITFYYAIVSGEWMTIDYMREP